MTTLLAILILVGFAVGLCYLFGGEYTMGSDGWPRETKFLERVKTGAICLIKFCVGVVVIAGGVTGGVYAVIWAIKELT